jgi:hypothetical protein
MSKKHLTNSPPTPESVGAKSAESSRDALAAQRAKNEAAIRLLRSWSEGDEQE